MNVTPRSGSVDLGRRCSGAALTGVAPPGMIRPKRPRPDQHIHLPSASGLPPPEATVSPFREALATGATTQPKGIWESVDFEEAEEGREIMTAQRTDGNPCLPSAEWPLIFAVGVGVGIVAWFQTLAVGRIVTWKLDTAQELLTDRGAGVAYVFSLAVWFFLALCAAALTLWAPQAAGSGIPQVKAYLNGVRIPGLFRFRTFVAKVLGIVCCLGIGFPAGREGPMVQVGAILASGLASGYASLGGCQLQLHMSDTRFEHRRRDFVAMGTAAGVAGAFNAPIGGVLFALEEVSSFWAGALTFRSFVCAIIAAYTVTVFLQGSDIEDEGWVLFGPQKSHITFHTTEIAPFALVGVLGGLVGALYNKVNTLCMGIRAKVFKGRKPVRIIEAVLHISLVMSVLFFLPFMFSCQPIPKFAGDFDHGLHFIRHQCAEDEFNPMATLTYNPQERLLLQLYSRQTPNFFSIGTLAVFVPVYFLLASVTFGIAVPSGLFIPSMIIGASMGRFVGEVLNLRYADCDPGVYALIGAASALGGITRMTVSLAAILVETTNDPNLILPVMLSLAVSKAVAERINDSIYDIVLERAGVVYLTGDTPPCGGARARDVMAASPVMLAQAAAAADVQSACATRHNAFPVVGAGSTFLGVVSRRRVEDAIERLTGARDPSSLHPGAVLDLQPFMDQTPFVAAESLSLNRTYRLFRGMGMRHLCIINRSHVVVGIITRSCFHGNLRVQAQSATSSPEAESSPDHGDGRRLPSAQSIRDALWKGGDGRIAGDAIDALPTSDQGVSPAPPSDHPLSGAAPPALPDAPPVADELVADELVPSPADARPVPAIPPPHESPRSRVRAAVSSPATHPSPHRGPASPASHVSPSPHGTPGRHRADTSEGSR